MTRPVRPASISLLFALALALGLSAALIAFLAVQAYAQSGTPGVSIRTLQTRMPEGGQALFTITRAGGDISQPLTVRIYTWEPQHPRNTHGSYYGAVYHNVTFDGGTDTATLLVNATDDGKGVAPAWLQADVDPPGSASYDRGSPDTATITITESNDDDVYVTISPDEAEVDEGESVDFELTRTGDASGALTVSVRVGDPGEVMRGNHWTPAPDRPTSVEFAAGQDTVTLSLETKDDQRDIPDQALSVTIAGGDDDDGAGGFGYWLGYPHAAGVTVEDDDTAPDLALSISPEMVSEGGTLTVSVERPSGNTAEVLNGRIRIEHSRTWTDPDAPAHQTNPFEGNFHIPAGGTAWTLDIQATDNGQPENDWRYTVTLLPRDGVPDDEASQYWTVGGAAVARALDTAYIRITVTADQEAVYEGEEATFTLTRTGSLAQELTVQVITAERAGTPDATNIQFQSVTFAAGSATATLALTVAEDDELEPDGDSLGVEVYVYPGAPYRGGDPDDAVTMVKDTGAIDIRTFQTRMREGAEALFTLTRADGAISQPLTVRVYTWEPQHPLNNEANGYFHGAAHHEVTFEAGAGSAALVVSATGDGKTPGRGAFLWAEVDPPSGASYRRGDPEYVSIVIVEADGRDAFVTVATAESEVDEGESVDFVLTRTGDTSRSLAVHVSVDDPGEVMRGNHWAPAPDRPTSVAFGVGEDSVMLSLETKDDQRDIPDQPVSVTIIAPAGSGYWLAYPRMAGFTVRDDDIAPELTVRSTESEVDEGGTFFVSVERPAGNTTEVLPGRIRIEHNRAWTDPNAAAHQTNPFEENFLIRPDKTGRLWQIEVPVNNLAEDDWQYTVTLLPREEVPEDEASQYWRVVGDGTATATVRDVGLPVITITANQESIFEGEEGTFTLSRTGGVWEPLTVQVLTWERRISDVDETRQEHQVTFEAGSATAIVARTIMDEWYTTREKELIALILPNPGQYRLSEDQRLFAVSMRVKDRSALLSIRADDQDGGADGEQDSITEGETATFTLTREGYISRALAVNVSVQDPGYFMRGNHWQPVPSIQPVRFEAGESTTVLELPTRDDLRDIPDNVLTVTVVPDPDGYYTVSMAPGESSASVTVRDNDVAPTIALSVDRAEITEGETFRLTLTRSGDTANSIELPLRFGPFGPPMSRIVGLGPGETQVTIPFHIEDDDRDEAEQDYYVGLAPYEGLLEDAMSQYWTVEGPRLLTVTVADNDLPLVGVEAARDSYSEGRLGAIRIFRANYVEDGGIVVNLRFIDTGNVIVQPHRPAVTGDRRYSVEDDQDTILYIHLAEEDGDEADGSFAVQLLEGDGYRVDPQHSATSFVVLDNDPTPVLSVTAATVSEGGESIDFRVALSSTVSPPSLQTVTVDYATRDGAAVAGEDYTAVRGTLTLAPEATEGVISVPLLDDGWAEDLETFSLVVTNPSNAMLPDGQSSLTITGTIEDDEPRVSVSAQSAQVMEGEPVTLILTRTGDTGEDLTFHLGIFEDHPSTFNGFSAPNVTIPAGQSTVQWDHETVDDDFDEADFTVSVSIIDYTQSTARTGYAWDGTHATATVTDNDLPVVTVEAVAEHQRHGADAVFTLTREADLTVPLTVNLSVTATDGAEGQGQAVNGFLTSQPPSTVTFATGASTVTVRLGTNRLSTKAVRLTATLTDADPYSVGDPASARILSVRGTLPIVSIRARSEDVQEGNWVTFDLTRTGSTDSSLEATVKLTKWNWNARADQTITVVFDAGSATTAWSRWAEDEEVNNGDTLYVAFVSGTASTYYVGLDGHPRRATVLVRDNDLPLVWLEPELGEHVEDGVSRPTFTLYRSGDTSNVLEIWFVVRDLWFVPQGPSLDIILLHPLSHQFLPGETSISVPRGYRQVSPLGAESHLTIQAVDALTADAIDRNSLLAHGLLSEGTYFLRPKYRIGTPASGFIMVHNSAIGLLIEADQSAVEEGETATFTLTRVGGTPLSRGYRMDVRVEATQEGDVISGVTPQTVSFPGLPELPKADAVHTITVSIPTIDDADYGDGGSITLTLLPSANPVGRHTQYEIGGSYGFNVPASATIRVIDNDRSEMSISDVSAFESDGVIKFTVSVAAGPRDVSVDWATADGSGDTAAIAGEDYTAASGALTIPAGETTGTITVMVMDDDLHENDETLTVQLSNAPDARLVESSATGTIKNDDFDQEVEIWTLATDRNLTEGETAMFTLRRQPPDGGVPPPGFGVTPLTVNISVSQDGDFIAGNPPATVTFPANHLYAQLRVPTEDDQTAEASGSVTVSLADGAGYSQGDLNQATVNLQDNDVGISITGGDPVRENVESGITFTVSLSRAASKPVTVDVTTVDGTATSDDTVTATSLGRDFEAKSATLTFEAGQTQKTFTVTLVDDTFDEPREEFTAQLSNASDNARLLVPTATGMINDDEEKLVLGVYRTRQRVAEDRGAPVDFLLELKPAASSGATASEFEVRVNWSLERGTAIPGADYVDASGKAIIPPGAASAMVEVSLVDDGLLEAIFETFSFRINGAFSADVDEDHESIEISIRDDDDVQADVAVATESIAEGADAEFTVSLSGALSTAPVEVTYAVSGTAGADDYTAPSGTLTIPALAAEATISITTLADDVEDDGETLIVTLTGATSHGRTLQVADTAAEATILDQGTLTVSITGGSATEGEEVQFTIAISPPPSYWVNVTYETVDPEGNVVGEALLGTDFQSTRSIALLTFVDPSKTFTIGTIEDNLVEGDETFEVRIVDVNSRFVGAEYGPAIDIASHTAVLTIIDDDVRPTNVTLTVTPDSVSEMADGTPLSVTATLDGDGRLLERLPVALSVSDGTATEGEDYTAVPVMLYIPAGQASATGPVVLFPVDDLVAGGDKTVQVTGAAAGMTATPATVTITDNETPPTGVALTVSPDEVREDAGATDLEVTATLTGGDRRPVDTEVRLTVEGVSLPAEQAEGGPTTGATGADFAANGVTLTIPAGEMTGTATLSLTPTDDPIAEGDERAQVTGAADGLTVTPAPVTIVDDDRETTGIELSVTPSEVKEDAGATDLTVTATLIDGDARGVDTEVALSVSGVTATETVDYTAQTDVTLTIPAGRMSHTATLTLTPVDDGIRESAEQVAIRGTSASAGLPVSGARVTITDNDADATAITLSLDRDMIPEDGGAQRLTVTGTLNGDLRSVDTRVTLSIAGQTATDSDYTALPATLVIGAGQREGTATVVLDPTNDDIDEPDETLEVRGQARSVPTQRASSQQSVPQSSLTVSAAQVTITDDDTAGVTVTPTAFTVLEGSSRSYTVVLDTQPAADVTVAVSLPGGSDLSISPTSLTFTDRNWSVARTVTVTADEDNDLADDGEVTIGHTVSSIDPLYAAATADSVTVTVNDDDDTVSVTFSAAAYSVDEGGTVDVTVTLGAAPEREVTIPIVKTDEGGITQDDYSGVPESVIFGAADTEKSFTFSATQDDVDDDEESVKLTFGTLPDGVSAGATIASTVTITDDDVPAVTVSFGAATYSVDEGGTVEVTVTLDAAPEREVTIPIVKTDEGGASEDDYSGVPESVVFAATDTEKSFTFTAAADDVDDDEESVALAFGTLPEGVSAGTTAASTVTITDDDVPSVSVSFSAATYSVAEGGTVDVTVTLDVAPEREVTIPIVKTDQGGISQDDYSGVPESVIFAATDTEKSFTFTAAADEVDDDDESVALAFGTLPDGVSAGATIASTVTITDDDAPAGTVSLVLTPATIDESGSSNVSTVTATLATASSADTTVTISAPQDAPVTLSSNKTLTIAKGATTSTGEVTITAVNDAVYTGDREVTVSGAASNTVGVANAEDATLTITDDEVRPVTVSFGGATYTAAEGGTVDVTVTLDAAPEREVTIPIVKTDQGGASEDDYSGVPESVTFGAADTEKSFTFNATQDDVDDDEESVKLTFGTLPDGVSAGATIASTVTITDDDAPAVSVSFSAATYSVAEGGTVDVTVTLDVAPEREVTIPIVKADQGGASEDDYSGVPESLTFAATDTEMSFTFTATADDVDDDDESVGLAFGTLPDGVSAGTTSASTVSITDDDVPAVTVGFGAATYSVAEDGTVDVKVTLNVAPEREVTIPIVKADQGGASEDDYSGVPESVVFGAAETEKSFTFTAAADDVDDDGESVGLAFGTLPDGVTAGTTATSTVSITDDDVPAVTVSFSAATYAVAEGSSGTVTLTLSAAPERSVTVPLTASNQGGASAADYSGVPANVVFNSGETEQTFTVAATQDTVDDDGESVKLTFGTLPDGVSAGTTATSTVSITDDDVPAVSVSFGAASYSVAEGSSGTVTLTLSAAPERSVTVPLTASNQGGASAADYSGVPANVVFNSGETEQTFTVAATQDTVDDDGESVKLTFGTLPEGVSAGTTAASTVTITDDDVPAVTVSFGAATYSVAEDGTVDVKVTLNVAPEREVTIPLTKTDQGGASEDDYSGVPESVTFGAAETEKSFTFSATQDDVDDDGESVKLAFGTLPAQVTGGATDEAVVSITDDTRGVTIDPTSFTVIAGRTNSYSVVLDTQPTANVAVTVSGHVNTDLSLDKTSLTFSADNWKTAQTVTVTADENAGARSVTLSHTVSGADYGSVSADDATVNILAAPSSITIQVGVTVSQQQLSVVEGGSQDYSLVLNTVPTGDVTVDITLPSGTDLSLDSATLTFTTANWSAPQTVTVSADEDDDATADDPVQISHTISGGGYDNTAVPDVRVTITENDLFDAEAMYRIFTRYGSPTEVELSEYLADGVTGVTFALESCDDTRSDYYDSAAVEDGKLRLASNTLGHIHGDNTRSETVCTVTATSADGYEEREFRLYMVSDRTPTPLLVGDLTLVEARPTELDVQVALPEGAIAYVRLAWRKLGGQPIFRVVSGVTDETVLTIPGLEAGIEYDVRAYLMSFQSFDLYRAGNTGPERTLIPEGSPAVKWVTNLTSSGLGKSQAITTRSAYGISVSIEDAEALEDVGSMSFDVTLDQASTDVVTVDWATSDGTAEAPGDYEATTSGQLTFAAGQTKQTLEVTIVDDAVDEAEEETFTVTLSNAANADLGVASATGTITDNDLPDVTVSFGATAYSVAEGGSVTVKVTLSAAPERDVTIPITAAGQDGASDSDYSGVPASLTFGAADTEKSFFFSATQDGVDDDGESVKLTFGALPAQVTGGTTDEAVVSINDDDAPASVAVSFGQSTYSVAEGSAVTITVQLDDDPEKTVTVPVSAAGQNGASAADYSGVPASVVFSSGDTEKSFTITAVADAVDDDGESVALAFGTLPAGVTAGTIGTATVSITDDDVPAVTVSFGSATYSVAEGGTVDVTVTLDAAPEREVTIPITATDQGGASADDYSGVPASVTFGAADTSKSFTFSAAQDAVDDDGESVKLTFGALPAQVTGGATDEAVVSITDDDAPASVAVSYGQSTYSVAEGSAVTVTVQLDDDPEKTVTVPVSAVGQNGASAADYSGVPASVTFNSGDTSKSFTFSAAADDVDDDGESVKLAFGTLPTGVSAGTTIASTVTITDDDVPAGTVSLVLTPATIDESGSSNVSTVTATLATASSADTTVTISAPQDAPVTLSSNKTLTIVKGATTSTGEVTISAVNDAVYTGDREVTVSGAASNEVGVANAEDATLTITDDEVRPVTASFGSATYSVAEGGTVDVTVTLDAAPEREVTIPITATDQGGAGVDDYSGVPASVTFGASDTSKSFTFSADDDAVDDDGESVKLAFGTLPAQVTGGTTGEAVVSITDDDAPASVAVSFGQSTYSVAEGSAVTITVQLDDDPEKTVTVPVSAAGQNGASAADYSGVPASVTFNSGDTSKSFTFSAAADEVDDDGESVKLAFGTLPTGVSAGTTIASTVTITDDDVPDVTVSFGSATYTVAEGGTVDVTVTLDAAPEREVTIPITATDQDGAGVDDYSGVPASVTFGAAETEKSFTFTATEDDVDDDGESVKLAFGTLPAQVTGGTTGEAVVSITDDDAPTSVAVSFGQSTYSVAEGSSVTITVQLDDDPEKTVTVPVSAAGQNGASAADYSGVPASVTFNSGDTSKSFTFSAAADDVDDDGESVKLAFGTLPTGVSAGTTIASTVTITDDDVPDVTVSFGSATYTVAEGGTVDVTVTLDAAPEREVTIPITANANGGASAADYSGIPASVTFNSGDISKSFSFSATADDVDDDGESVKLAFGTLPAQVTGGATDEAVVSITDDDAPASVAVSFGQSTYSVAEGSAVTITVQLDDDPEKTVTVPVSAAGQNGASAADYSGVPASVTFNSGDTSKSFTFTAAADDVDDDGESVALAFGTLPEGVTAGTTGTTSVSITDGDLPDVTVSFGSATYTVAEGGTVDVTVTLDAAPEREVTIPITATDQDGAGVDDYSGVPASVTFGAAETEKSFTFTATEDDVDDDGESVKLAFGTLPAQVTGGATDEAVVSITDDDAPTSVAVSFGQSTYSVAEGSAVTITVQLDDDPEKTVTVPVSAAGQNGASADDYSGVPASVTFNSGDTSKSFTFSAAADEVDDDGESVKLAFGTLPTGVSAGTTIASTVTITDDDVPAGTVSLVLTPATIDESGSSNVSTVTATLATASSADTTVTISAPQDAPVTLSSNKTLTIVKGATTSTGEVTISAVNDAVYTGDREVTVSGAASNTVGVANAEDATLTITDDEVRPVTASFGSATYSVAEGGTVDVTVTLDAAPEREVTIPITATDQSGASADDYSGVPASVTFAAAETEKSFSIAAAADDVDDDGESVALAFGTLPAGVTAGTTNTATVSILQAAALSSSILVSFSSSSYSATEGGNNAQVTVLLSSQPQSTVDIPLTATGASGATEDDWSGVPASLTFNPGDPSQTFTVIATDDDVEDNGEMVQLGLGDLPHGFEAGEPATATITIMNDDTEGTPDSACPGAVWCATLTFSSEGSLHYDDHRQTFLGWHYRADSVSNTGATLSDSNFTYREKDYSFIGIWLFPAPRDRSSCTSELQLNIHSSDGLLADLDLFESLDASKGLKLIVDDNLEFPITVDTKRHPHMMGFLHPYFYSIRAGSTVELRIEETDIASSGGDGAAGDALTKPRCVHVSSYPHNTPETGLVGLEITWQKPSLDGSPNILSGAANVDSYKVQWKMAGDSWDNLDAVSEESSSSSLYHVILGLTEGVDYSVRVIATNGLRDSPPSEEATGAPTEVVRPELSTATVNGSTLTLAYDEALDANSAPEIDSFEVTVAGAKRDVAGVTVEGSAVVLTLGEAVGPDDEVELNYFPAWYIEEGRIQDVLGNAALGFVDQAVTNDTAAAAQAQAAEEVTPLTASFSDVPASHDGQSSFTFRIAFSEPIATSYEVVRDQSLEVTGGSVTQARRIDGRSDLWEIAVEPGSNADVTVALHPDRACDAEGAICTDDGTRLSNGLALLVPGPIVRQGPEPNRPATGSPTIAGTLRVGEALMVDTTDIVDEDGLDNATYNYQWLADGTSIEGATESTYTVTSSDSGKIMTVRASFTDDGGNDETLTSATTAPVASAPVEPLTASHKDAPTTHDGNPFSFELRFSEEPDSEFSYVTLRDHAFVVTGGAATSASRKERGSNLRWEITILPDSDADVTVVLPVTTDCAAAGAVCTSGGKKLSERLELTVSGPEQEEEDEPQPTQQQQPDGEEGQQQPQSPPPAPTSLTALVNDDGHIVLSWTAPDDDSVTGYQILRRRPAEGEDELLVYVANTDSTVTTWSDTNVTSGVQHVYRVKAINSAGQSHWSNYVNPTP